MSDTLITYLSLRVLSIPPSSVSPTVAVVGLLLLWLIGLGAFAFGVLYITILVIARFPRAALPSENTYRTTSGSGVLVLGKLPHIGQDLDDDEQQQQQQRVDKVDVSVVVPAYNETERLPKMLNEAVDVLEKWELEEGRRVTYEILVVDDGSGDKTAATALTFAEQKGLPEERIRVCALEKNRGKGGAVTHGMQRTRGDYIIFADADGASQFSDIKTLHASLTAAETHSSRASSPGIALGSRAHMVKSEAVVKRSFIRNFLMYSLHTLLYVFGIRTIRDTQCGFKMFTRSAVAEIFPFMHNEGWIFDVEVLILAERKGIPVVEVPISWHEVAGSKMELAKDSVKMAIDLVVIRCAYILGIYDDGRKRDADKVLRKKKDS
ncbi:nucleotide-diphospho-sugar transferase [Lipomyces kononenkoae]|uniref:Nucleotide-diphospho-sugar transferase n=1 Tax=Lipomyces kononenkoae TaxID=34357 RepID=A0ACC3SYK2_LIPKO